MQRRGRQNHDAGLMAEDCTARHYAAEGARILDRRCRTPHGELDLVVIEAGILVFVEVKRRRRITTFDCIVTERQWERLELAATHYMLHEAEKTGKTLDCRFDVAIVDADAVVRIIKNARSC